MRRSHDSKINVILDKESGEPRLSHKIDLATGMYKGREILKRKQKKIIKIMSEGQVVIAIDAMGGENSPYKVSRVLKYFYKRKRY